MKRNLAILLILTTVLTLFMVGCNKDEEETPAVETPEAMTISPRELTEEEQDFYYTMSSAEVYSSVYNVDETITKAKMQIMKFSPEGYWETIQEKDHQLDPNYPTFTIEFYPELASIATVVGKEPSVRGSGLEMSPPEGKYYDLRSSDIEFKAGQNIPLLMIYGKGDPAIMPQSTTMNTWGNAELLMEDDARYVLTITFLE